MSFKGKNLEQHREIKFIIYILLEICSDLVLLHAIFYLRDTHSRFYNVQNIINFPEILKKL